MPYRIVTISVPLFGVAEDCSTLVGEDAGHRREVTDVAFDDAEEAADGFLVRCDRIEIAHRFISRPSGRHFDAGHESE